MRAFLVAAVDKRLHARSPITTMSLLTPVTAGTLLRQPSFLFFLLSRSLTRFASQIGAVAIGWQIYDLTGSAFDLGMVGLVQFLPTALLVFVAGQAADKFERKRVVQLCQLAEALDRFVPLLGLLCRLAHRGPHLYRDLRAGHGGCVRKPDHRGAVAADCAARFAATRHRAVERRRSSGDHHRPRARRHWPMRSRPVCPTASCWRSGFSARC